MRLLEKNTQLLNNTFLNRLLNFPISAGSFKSQVECILNRKTGIVLAANVHMFIEAIRDPTFFKLVNQSDIVTPDGKPLCMALKWLYGIEQERVSGMDLLPALLEKAEENNLKVGFYGYTIEGLEVVHNKCKQLYPKLQAPLTISPPFRSLTEEEQGEYIKAIHKAGVQLLFVALGCPKQEKWMASMSGRLNTTMVGIGAALPVFAGLQKRAPFWMQKYSLEWLFRLFQEPRRLFKRYFITNTHFIHIIIKEKLKLTFDSKYKRKIFSEILK